MAPPAADATKASAPAPTFVVDEEPTPPATAASGEGRVVVVPEQATVVTAQAAPGTVPPPAVPTEAPPPVRESEADEGFQYKTWHRLHLMIGGGGSFGTRVYGEAEPFNLAAQKLKGPMFLIQPSFTVFALNPREEKPNGDVEVRLGVDIKDHLLANSSKQSVPDSSVSALSVGLLAEGIYHLGRHFGAGLNFTFGRTGLMSDDADVGAPFTATLDWGSENLWSAGAQLFLTVWDGNLRLNGNFDTTFGAFDLDAGQGNPALRTAMDPIIGFGVGVDPIGVIRSLSGGKSSEKKDKK